MQPVFRWAKGSGLLWEEKCCRYRNFSISPPRPTMGHMFPPCYLPSCSVLQRLRIALLEQGKVLLPSCWIFKMSFIWRKKVCSGQRPDSNYFALKGEAITESSPTLKALILITVVVLEPFTLHSLPNLIPAPPTISLMWGREVEIHTQLIVLFSLWCYNLNQEGNNNYKNKGDHNGPAQQCASECLMPAQVCHP